MDSMTAKVSCFARAYHYANNRAHVFGDIYAKALLGDDYDIIANHMTQGIPFFLPDFTASAEEGLRKIVDEQLSPSVLGRSAYCEAMLQNEMRLCTYQHVIFASGYDTTGMNRIYRFLSLYELDLPEMIEEKKKRVEAANLKSISRYVPCDLAKDEWKERLIQAGFRPDKKMFGSLLGISYYLTKEEFRHLLSQISSIMAPGSCFVFDYPTTNEDEHATTNQQLAQGAGETMKATYTIEELMLILQDCRLLMYEHLDDEEMTQQYFKNYNDRNPNHPLSAPKGVGYVLAAKKY